VIQNGDPAEIEKFVRENFAQRALQQMSWEERANFHKEFFADTGGLKVATVMDLGENEVEIRAQAVKTGDWYRVALRVEPQEPYGIMGFMFEQAGPPAVGHWPPPACAGERPRTPRSRPFSTRESDRPAKSRLAVNEAFAGSRSSPAAEAVRRLRKPAPARRVREHPPRPGATGRYRKPQNPGGLRGRTTTTRRIDAFPCTWHDENPVCQIQLKTEQNTQYSVHNCCKFSQFSHKLST